MVSWSADRREYTEYRWVLGYPAHPSDMASTIHAANTAWEGAAPGKSDIRIQPEDSTLIVSFTVPKPRETRTSAMVDLGYSESEPWDD